MKISSPFDEPIYPTDNVKVRLAKKIRYHRRQLKYSQEYLANLCEINRLHMTNIENARVDVSLTMLSKIAKGLEVSLYQLFDFEKIKVETI
jgi:DNA-binding XRE family transcriptional regulator